mmetsp:Transcript_2185/g.4233  ORF Transcript_2185/g.4233 Transcript_2185/m.4233 type:complete len:338 (-) Transcript_2185:419-1432(-)
MVPPTIASYASFSSSKQRAGPRWCTFSLPESLHTADSGHRLPCSTRMWLPAGLNGRATGKRTCCPAASSPRVGAAARFSATVLPVHVMQPPCRKPAVSSSFMITGSPPCSSMSTTWNLPCGEHAARMGTCRPILSKSSMQNCDFGMSASCAMASRCSTQLVLPPHAYSTVTAFSRASFVMIWRHVRLAARRLTSASAACSQSLRLAVGTLCGSLRVIAGWLALPGHAMPIASIAKAIDEAVNIAAQLPLPGAATHSSRVSSSMSSSPAVSCGMISLIAPPSSRRCSPPGQSRLAEARPGKAGPPKSESPIMSFLASGITTPPTLLSQPPSVTIASAL